MKNIFSLFLFLALFASCEKNVDSASKPTACFTYSHSYTSELGPIRGKDSIVFENCSENANSYLWDFGDGTTSTEVNPVHIYDNEMPVIVSLTAFNSESSNMLIDTLWGWDIVYKPNIYIYPEKTIELCVNLSFPNGGSLITSIPQYSNGWCVNVEPSGKINGNYDFLFYESIQPNIWQKENGWVIKKENLTGFFIGNMKAYGFNTNEIDDFIEYWIPLLSNSNFYTIYPQTKGIIDQVIKLDFSEQPKNINRLFYVIEEVEKAKELPKPLIEAFDKESYYVNEWGVVY